jgi:hypothetical protein
MEVDYEVPIPDSIAASLGSLAEQSSMKLTLWEKAWVHPLTGSIIDYAKEINTYLYLPELPEIPEIKYPSDLVSNTGFDGELILFDQGSASFVSYEGIKADRVIEVISADGYELTANESVTVTTADGGSLSLLDSKIQVVFDARDGSHQGPGRTGQYLFSPQGAGQMNYSIWDDGFGMEVNAEYIGQETELFTGLVANKYHVYVENETYAAGGVATLDMTYWVEETSGIVLDVLKKVTNWRPQDARRLPVDTATINKTVTLNATVTAFNPITQEAMPMDIYIEQVVNCSGFTNMTLGVGKFTETVTKYLPNGTMMSPPTVAKFGVDAYTMDYVHVDGWSTMDRTGQYTFPIGLLNETGEVTPMFQMYNSDLGMSFPVMLIEEMEMNGLMVAKYEMNLSDIPLTYTQVVETLGQDPGLPGATGTYGGLYEYYVDIDTGTIVDIARHVSIYLVPPTYEYLYDNLDSTTVMKGEFNGENITITRMMTGEDYGEGYTKLTVNTTYLLDDGSDFFPEVNGVAMINTTSHEVVNETMAPQGYYILFPANPTQMDNYTQVQMLAGIPLNGVATKGDMTATTVNYTWVNMTEVDGGLFSPMLVGTNWTMTYTYDYHLDIMTGMVLDATVTIHLVDLNTTYPNMTAVFTTTEMTKADYQMSNSVVGWALSGMHAQVLEISMDLYDMEVTTAVMKAKATSQLLLVADGIKPALDLELRFNATTKATMLATATATVEQLSQLPALMGAYQLKGLLESKDNKILFIYYKKVNEDSELNQFEDIDGSVEYWADIAKDKDAEYNNYAVVLPTILYVLAGIGIVVGLVLILAPGRKTEEAEE